MLPTQVGRYQIIEELGRGAMGVVYRGYDPTIGRTVAVKTVQLDAGDTELVMRFRREVQAAGVLSHPNIVTIYDAGEDHGLFYIAMELVEGETLQKMLAQGPLPVEQVIRLAEQIAAALDHAHGHYIVHRDVKPANIIVSGAHVKVMDFGIAKVTGATMTGTGQVLGTPSYMSPEVVKGQGADSRSDLFSLGVMLYEMLTGTKPFLGDNITTVIYKIIGEHPEPPSAVKASLDPGVNCVLLKALAKNPAERYQSCGELVTDLKNHAAYRERGQRMAQAAAARGAAVAPAAVPAAPLDDGAASATLPLDARTIVTGRGQVTPAAAGASAASAAAAPAVARPGRRRKPLLAGIVAAAVLVLAAIGGGLLWKGRKAGAPQRPPAPQQAAPAPSVTPPPAPGEAAPAPPDATPAQPAAGPAPSDSAAKTTRTPSKPAEIEFVVSAGENSASIRIDGREQPEWQTPYRFKLPVGKHTIEVHKPGFQPARREVEFTRNGPRSIVMELAPSQATCHIMTIPPGAEVYFDGQQQAAPTPSAYTLSFGEHKVSIRKPGYQAVERVVQIGDATPPAIRVLLVPERLIVTEQPVRPPVAPPVAAPQGTGRLSIRTNPGGASIIVDGTPTQYRTPVNIPLPSGKHSIVIERRGFASETHEVTIRKDDMTNLELALTPAAEKRRRFPAR
jgi:serine/threonine-protein kinase